MNLRVVKRSTLRETVTVEVPDGMNDDETIRWAVGMAENGEHGDPYDREYSEEKVLSVWREDDTLVCVWEAS